MDYITDLKRRLQSVQLKDKFPRLRKFLALRDREERISSNPWLLLQEYIGPADSWPAIVRKKFWCSDLRYRDRAFFASLIYGNGLPVEEVINCLRFTNSAASVKKLNQIRAVHSWLGDESEAGALRRHHYYYYDFFSRSVLTLNGERRASTGLRFSSTSLNLFASSVDEQPHLPASTVVETGYHC